jgi:hypothetical protein
MNGILALSDMLAGPARLAATLDADVIAKSGHLLSIITIRLPSRGRQDPRPSRSIWQRPLRTSPAQSREKAGQKARTRVFGPPGPANRDG